MQHNHIRVLTRSAIGIALMAIGSQIAIPLPFSPVPINLAVFMVLVLAAVFGSKQAALLQLVYLLLGGIGLPIFARFSGGFSVLVGPTGGFLLSYPLISLVVGNASLQRFLAYPFLMAVGVALCYTCGSVWYMHYSSTTFPQALLLCVVPFLLGDLFKIITAAFVVKELEAVQPSLFTPSNKK